MNLHEGRPQNMNNRMEQEKDTYDLLDELSVEFLGTDHPPADTMAVCEERAKVLNTRICKNLFLCNRQENTFYLLCMPADKQFKTSIVSGQLGVSRLHFAPEEFMKRYLNLCPGSVSIMGLMYDTENHVNLLIDEDLKEQEYFACHPCINTSSIKFKTSELFNKLLPNMRHQPRFVKLPKEID